MITQDNRPQPDSPEHKIDILKSLLHDDLTPSSTTAAKISVPGKDKDKIIFISVNGNNNVVSTEKSQSFARGFGKKVSFAAIIVICSLFF